MAHGSRNIIYPKQDEKIVDYEKIFEPQEFDSTSYTTQLVPTKAFSARRKAGEVLPEGSITNFKESPHNQNFIKSNLKNFSTMNKNSIYRLKKNDTLLTRKDTGHHGSIK